jgi:hypothetical protein
MSRPEGDCCLNEDDAGLRGGGIQSGQRLAGWRTAWPWVVLAVALGGGARAADLTAVWVFPQVVGGGGYASEILFSNPGIQSEPVTLYFHHITAAESSRSSRAPR